MAKRRRSLIDRFKQKQAETFIGRKDFIDNFTKNLEREDPTIIYAIHGQGGVGKTYLSKKYRTIVDAKNGISVFTDESIPSLLDWMGNVAKQFKEKGHELKEFTKRYKLYLQETKKLEADPEKPKGTLGAIVRTISKGAIKEAKKQLPGGEVIGSFIDEDGLAKTAGEWVEWVKTKIGNKDEVDLVLRPIEVLSPLFWSDIDRFAEEFSCICFFIDTYEYSDQYLEEWLLDVFNGKHGDAIPENCLFVIAGRNVLNANKWSAFSSSAALEEISLNSFTEEEANQYLDSNQITDQAIRKDIIDLSDCLPVLLAWLVKTAKSNPTNLQRVSATAVDRFLHWVQDEEKKQIALQLSVARAFNQDTLSALIEDATKAKALFDWITDQPFVLPKGDRWAYHDVVKSHMQSYLQNRSQEDWKIIHSKFVDYYLQKQEALHCTDEEQKTNANWFAMEVEQLFHSLSMDRQASLKTIIRYIVYYWYEGKLDSVRVLGTIFLHTKEQALIIKQWQGFIEKDIYPIGNREDKVELIVLIKHLIQTQYIENPEQNAFLYLQMGLAYAEQEKYAEAIESYKKSLAIKPDQDSAYYNMGIAYAEQEKYDEAIACYKKSLQINPDKDSAYYNMGLAYAEQEKYEEAIGFYKKSLAIKPNQDAAYNNMGVAYAEQEKYEEAIGFYKKSLAINSDQYTTYNNMGLAHTDQGKYDEAIESYKKSLQIKADQYGVYNNMGNAYVEQGKYEEAIESYKKSLQIKPDQDEAYIDIGFIYLIIGSLEKSQEALERALSLGELSYASMNLGHIQLAQKDEAKALDYYYQSIKARDDQQSFWDGMQEDYQYLEQYGITEAYYQSILQKIKERLEAEE